MECEMEREIDREKYRVQRNQWCILAAIIIVVIMYITWKAYHYSIYNTSLVYSLLDGEPYWVHNAHEDKQGAADRLAVIYKNIIKLLRHLKTKYTNPDDSNYEKVQFLLDNFNPDVILENSPLNVRNFTAYTENKGQTFCLCLRQRYTEHNEFISMNTVMFVVIHEISHLFTPIFGHDKPFWVNFKFLLGEAIEIGIYNPVDYMFYPIDYCGMLIDYSPYFDDNL